MGDDLLNASRQSAVKAAQEIQQSCEALALKLDWKLGWQQHEGNVAQVICEESRYNDLLLLGSPAPGAAQDSFHGNVHSILLDAGTACLVMPGDIPAMAQLPQRILLGWNNSRESSRALRAAMPFLIKAKEVFVLSVNERQDDAEVFAAINGKAVAYLQSHGVTARPVVLPRQGEGIAAVVQQQLEEFSPDMLVLGAYGHTRLREAVMGGVTRNVLKHVAIPMLFGH